MTAHQESPLSALPDTTLLSRIEAGDAEALTVFAKRHQRRLFGYLRALSRSDAQAEDALQETLLAVWRTSQEPGGRHRPDTPVIGWLLSIARHALYRGARRRAGEPAQTEGLEALAQAAGWGADTDPERVLRALQSRDCVQEALLELDELDREVITLRDLQGFSGEETAAALGLSLAATKSRLHRARLKLHARVLEVCDAG